VAKQHNATSAQIALAWVLRQPRVIAIPKAGEVEHVRSNASAGEIELTKDDLAALDAAFPRPSEKEPLQML
jgi:diketogulonate reductase-like aldo/keto reductase